VKVSKLEIIYFGGGCFWCIEAIFSRLRGVESVISGYAGGRRPNPSYEQVTTGVTGHAEVVEVKFDSDQVSLEQLLEVFWATHDPTSLNRQGADEGTQYRSIILTTSEEQQEQTEKSKLELQNTLSSHTPVVTEIEPLTEFYTAEQYHQKYYDRQPNAPYCSFVIGPKLEKLEAKFAHLLKAEYSS
jgi:peptide-methionine (S)-S-oxide reductase